MVSAFISDDVSETYWNDVKALLKANEDLHDNLVLHLLDQTKSLGLFYQNYSILERKIGSLFGIMNVSVGVIFEMLAINWLVRRKTGMTAKFSHSCMLLYFACNFSRKFPLAIHLYILHLRCTFKL